jgi:hypothetical protein
MLLPGDGTFFSSKLFAPARGVLDHDHRVGPVRDHAAGEDLDGLALADALLGGPARRRLVHNREDAPDLGVGATDREPVHRRVVKRRRVGGGQEISRQRQPEGLTELYLLHRQPRRALEHQPLGLRILDELLEKLHPHTSSAPDIFCTPKYATTRRRAGTGRG